MGFQQYGGVVMAKAKVVLLPLDERPCNYNFPSLLFHNSEFQIVKPSVLGDKKQAAKVEELEDFLKKECVDADFAVIAVDTLLYGGLIPSRLHHRNKEEVLERLLLLRKIKEDNPKLKIYAFQCIMRCPINSSNDEEPDYYEQCGSEIHQLGALIHKEQLGINNNESKDDLLSKIPEEALQDYCNRRNFNLEINIEVLKLAKNNVIDFLIIPQDDSAPYGYTAMDQKTVRGKIREYGLSEKVYVYPGADEIELTLLTRALNELEQKTPKVYVKYASIKAPFLIPSYEDRPLGETVKYHLMAAGCIQVASESEADLILALNAPAASMREAVAQPVDHSDYDVERNLAEFVYAIEYYLKQGIPVTIGDNAYANGGELELIAILDRKELLLKVAGYAGWNTSSNTIGTAIAQGVKYLYQGDNLSHKEFLLLRYLEDVGYCALIRKEITENKLSAFNMNYFDIKEKQGVVSEIVKEQLLVFADTRLSSIKDHIHINSVSMPWRRMFETEILVSYR